MNDVVYLEPDDEITSVIDKLKLTDAPLVVLVIPRGSTLAQSIINLKILKRSAEEIEKEFVLVANDRIAANLASQVGIGVYSKVSEAENAEPTKPVKAKKLVQIEGEEPTDIKVNSYLRYDAGGEERSEELKPAESKADREEEEEAAPEDLPSGEVEEEEETELSQPAEERELPAEEKKPMPRRVRRSIKPFLILTAVVIIITVTFAALFLPYASASVQLKTEEYNNEETVAVNQNIDAVNAEAVTIPGKLFQIEKELTRNYTASGKKNVGTSAKGKMTISNRYDTSPHQYPKGTKFTSSDKVFLADSDFTVSAGQPTLVNGVAGVNPGEGSVNVTAEKPGDGYNMTAGNFVVGGAPATITARSGELSGGVTKEIGVVTEDDLAKAEADLTAALAAEAKKEMAESAAAAGFVQIEASQSAAAISSSHSKNAEDEADSFDFSLKQRFAASGFKESDLKSLMSGLIQAKIGGNKMVVNPDKSEISYTPLEGNQDQNTLKLKAKFKGRVAEKVSQAEIKSILKNKKTESAKIKLAENSNVEKVDLKTWPGFLSRTPLLSSRINVKFDYAK